MKILSDMKLIKSRGLVELECEACLKSFFRQKNNVLSSIKGGKYPFNFCSRKCYFSQFRTNFNCKQCGKESSRQNSQMKFKNSFCSQSCAATFNNMNKSYGIRRSKLEIWIEEQLKTEFPLLAIDYCKKDVINSELDIYIPSLKLAFELNGIFHYEPIFGKDKLLQIKNNDQRKFQACFEMGIELCIIDTSKFGYFKLDKAKVFFDIIKTIIMNKLQENL